MEKWLLLCLVATIALADTLPACKADSHVTEEFIECDAGLDAPGLVVAAFGDFDANKFVDVVVIENQTTVSIYAWQSSQFKYQRVNTSEIVVDNAVLDVLVADFNQDGKLDVMLTLDTTPITVQLYTRSSADTMSFEATGNPLQTGTRPIIVDYNRDGMIDLFATLPDGTWAFFENTDASFVAKTDTFAEYTDLRPIHPYARHAFVDIDGDCQADLVVLTGTISEPYLEIWSAAKDYSNRTREISLPAYSHMPSFSDVNGDGAIDLVIPVCQSTSDDSVSCDVTSEIQIVWNWQKGLCEMLWTADCRTTSEICVIDDDYELNPENASILNLLTAFESPLPFQHTGDPVVLRFGDVDLSRNPDILIPVVVDNVPQMKLLQAVQCSSDETLAGCENKTSTAARSYLTYQLYHEDHGSTPMTRVENATAGGFVDFNKDGRLGILLLTTDADGISRIVAMAPWEDDRPLFVKVIVANGNNWRDQEKKPYGALTPGSTVKFTYTDLMAKKRFVAGTQLTQFTHLSLQPPFALFGLGEQGNYIETLIVSPPVAIGTPYKQWSTIVPKGQLIVFPYPYSDPSKWYVELYVSPSATSLFVLLATLGALLVLGVIIAVLKYLEYLEDEKEREQSSYLFTF